MDLINRIIREKSTEILSSLTNQGFSDEQAQSFLEETGETVVSAIGTGGVNMDAEDIGDPTESVFGNFDIQSLAATLGIDVSLASSGLAVVVPMLMSTLRSSLGDSQSILGALTQKGTEGELLAKAKSLC